MVLDDNDGDVDIGDDLIIIGDIAAGSAVFANSEEDEDWTGLDWLTLN